MIFSPADPLPTYETLGNPIFGTYSKLANVPTKRPHVTSNNPKVWASISKSSKNGSIFKFHVTCTPKFDLCQIEANLGQNLACHLQLWLDAGCFRGGLYSDHHLWFNILRVDVFKRFYFKKLHCGPFFFGKIGGSDFLSSKCPICENWGKTRLFSVSFGQKLLLRIVVTFMVFQSKKLGL